MSRTDQWIGEAWAAVGWDFSRLDGRLAADDPPWNFEADCRDELQRLGAFGVAVDLGTGGGERLLALIAQLPEPGELHATEAWEPNIPIATEALGAHGIPVHRYDAETGDRMPFADATVDLVMCRHESLDAMEAARVLRAGGLLLTQQVHGLEVPELRAWFGGEPQHPNVTTERFVTDCEAAGLRVRTVADWSGTMRFTDAEALVTYLGLVPWDVPDFDVDEHAERLLELDKGPIEVTQRRFRVHAEKVE